MSQFEQWANIRFSKKLGKSTGQTFQMIKQVCGKEALGCSAVFKWHRRFAQGRGSWEDHEHTGWPRTVRTEFRIQEVSTLVRTNRSQTVDEIATAAEVISHGTCPQNSV
jgi:transposase-like protein